MPYWRLSGFYLFYFAALGVLVPYWGLYLQSLGFTPIQIGSLMALLMLSRIVAPLVWGWIADHREQRMRVARLACLLAVLSFTGVFAGSTFVWLAVVMTVFSFFWHASLPLVEVATLSHTAERPGEYGRVRLWGSIGFIVAVLALGPIVDHHGPFWVLPATTFLMTGIWAFSLMLPEAGQGRGVESPDSFRRTVMRPEVFGFLAACFLMQASHGPYYTFYSIYLDGYGYSKTVIGGLWAFGVICEIGVFLMMPFLLARFDLRQVLLTSFLLASVRWLLIAFFPNEPVLLTLAQLLHAATFGAFHAVAIQMVYRFFTGRHRHRGQAVYGSASFGIGGAVGGYLSGYGWEVLGSTLTYGLAAILPLAAWLVGWRLLRPGRA
ncbi:MAG: MFS transporter [Candidatus Muproteobacteria bacterium RBG_16_62_13]|uniref:MFS transporter n=1 Tax=Candidatus Muproteobacteria bacterium RBG_16_62_13 TaxID=1817756 RepID=A0A1F6SZX1_9PROT|nr:MAG: MFS transporter [Candidatus Muproteobacteria bacterium RBG_16_62_13]